jgi:hypothetical protein
MIIHLHHLADYNNMLPRQPKNARRLAQDGVLAVSTRSLRGPTVARPEALAVASPGQAWFQILDLALISIFGIRTQINHMKLDKHIQRLFLSSSVRIARSKYFLYFLFSLLFEYKLLT